MKIYARHGDIPVYRIDNDSTTKGTEVKKLIVAEGEVTGHHHEVIPFKGGKVEVLDADEQVDKLLDEINRDSKDSTIVRVTGKAGLVHQEHGTIELPEGTYVFTRQIQYDPFSKIIERVRD